MLASLEETRLTMFAEEVRRTQIQDLDSHFSFEQAYLEQLIIQEALPSEPSNVTLHKSIPPYF